MSLVAFSSSKLLPNRLRTASRWLLCACFLPAAGAAAGTRETPTSWWITDVTVIPVIGGQAPVPHRDVLVSDGRIARIVAHDTRAPTPDAHSIDGSGRFLVPGFVDAHAHLPTDADLPRAAVPGITADAHAYDRLVLLMYLRAGVTGVANLGGSERNDQHLLWLRGEIAGGRIAGPTLYVGKRINGQPKDVSADRTGLAPSTLARPTNAADARAAVLAAHRAGYDFIKPYQHLNREAYPAVVRQARALGLMTTGHLPELGCAVCMDEAGAFAEPMDNIAHSEELSRYALAYGLAPGAAEKLASEVAARGISVTPTLVTQKAIVSMYFDRQVLSPPGEWAARVDPLTLRDWSAPNNRYLSAEFRAQQGAELFPAMYDFSRILTRELWRKGVRLTVGTDAPMPGLAFGISVQQEMLELAKLGIPAADVLAAASTHADQLLRPDHAPQGVRVGAKADLVLLDADPLLDIHHIDSIAGVFANGHWLTVRQLDRALDEALEQVRAQYPDDPPVAD